MEFTYPSRLGPEHLRLLRPLSISREALRFEVSDVRRSAAPPYTAVSYTWGNLEASEVIYLNGKAFSVRPNLWSCLYYLAQDARQTGWTHLWVDAICINQSSKEERNAQVSRMDQTYSEATCVSVWLGLPSLPDFIMSDWPQHVPLKTVEVNDFDWSDSMTDLANRPYWSRFWVIQEILLGKDVELYCGKPRIPWIDFQEILCRESGVQQFRAEFGSLGNPTNGLATSYRALPLVMGRHVDKHPEFLQSLHDLLISHHRSECKDSRDRVFALLGLVTRDERALLARFFPDYSMTEDHVRIIALAHVRHFNLLEGGQTVSPGSDELFLGLGVESRAQRMKLLYRARNLDYLGYETRGEVSRALAMRNTITPYQDVYEDEDHVTEVSRILAMVDAFAPYRDVYEDEHYVTSDDLPSPGSSRPGIFCICAFGGFLTVLVYLGFRGFRAR